MKNIIISILSFVYLHSALWGQNNETIGVNAANNVHIIFESTITKATIGNPNYAMMYEPGDKIIILKGVKADKSNLFVITADGLMYNMLVQYKENLVNYYKIIPKTDAINYVKVPVVEVMEKSNTATIVSAKQIIKDSINSPKSIAKPQTLYDTDKKAYMRKIGAALSIQKNYYSRLFSTRENLIFQLMNIAYNKNELYFYFEMENKGGTDYDVDYFNYAISTKNFKKRSNTQSETIVPIYTYHLPKTIKRNSKQRFVVVFKQFNISKNKVFIAEVKDKNGERDIYIPIQHKQLNNPNLYNDKLYYN